MRSVGIMDERFSCELYALTYRHERGLRTHYLVTHGLGYYRRQGLFSYNDPAEAERRRQSAVRSRLNPRRRRAHSRAASAAAAGPDPVRPSSATTPQAAPGLSSHVYLPITLNGRKGYALLDSGCDASVVSRWLLPADLELEPPRGNLLAANSTEIPLLGEVVLSFEIAGNTRLH